MALILLSTCATLDRAFIDDESNRVELEDLKLEMDAEVFHFRADLIRQTTEENMTTVDGTGAFATEEEEVEVPYHYVGVRFGNGLFLDYNQNLSVDLIEFFGLEDEDFKIIQKMNTGDIFNPGIEYARVGNSFTREEKILLGKKSTARLGENRIVVEEGLFKTEVEILLEEDKILCKPGGVFGFLGKAEIRKGDDDNLSIPGLWKDAEFSRIDSNTIEMDKYFTIEKSGNEILINYKGLFGLSVTYHFIRTSTGFVFYDDNYLGVIALRDGDEIVVKRNRAEIFNARFE